MRASASAIVFLSAVTVRFMSSESIANSLFDLSFTCASKSPSMILPNVAFIPKILYTTKIFTSEYVAAKSAANTSTSINVLTKMATFRANSASATGSSATMQYPFASMYMPYEGSPATLATNSSRGAFAWIALERPASSRVCPSAHAYPL